MSKLVVNQDFVPSPVTGPNDNMAGCTLSRPLARQIAQNLTPGHPLSAGRLHIQLMIFQIILTMVPTQP